MTQGLSRSPQRRSTPRRARALVVDYRLLVDDLVRGLLDRGWQLERLQPAALRIASFEQACRRLRPDLVLSVNYAPPVAALAGLLRIPYVSWTIDPLPPARIRMLRGARPELCYAFSHSERQLELFADLGLSGEYLPLAAPGDRRRTLEDSRRLEPYRCELSFVGSSLTSEVRALGFAFEALRLNEQQIAVIHEELVEVATSHENDRGFAGYGADLRSLPGPLRDRLSKESDRVVVTDLLNGALAHLHRLRCISALRSLGIRIYGDPGWLSPGRDFRGAAAHGDQLTLIYNASRINLDLPRIYQRDIITMRVFDVLASGGLLLSEGNDALERLFRPNVHLATYETTAALPSRVRELLDDPERCAELARAGQREVRAHHLVKHRIDQILTRCAERGWLPG